MGDYGIKIKTTGMARSLWLSPKGATRLRVHASTWPTREAAQAYSDAMSTDTRNAHLELRVARF